MRGTTWLLSDDDMVLVAEGGAKLGTKAAC